MLNELDRQTGDGDTGATLARGVKGKNVFSYLANVFIVNNELRSTL